jgi:hypothetical protein
MFCGGLKESLMNEIDILVEEVRPDVFWTLLRWLYGQSFEDATNSVLRKPNDFTSEEGSYESYYLLFLVNLLKAADFYDVEPLKDKVEDIIINGAYISVANVCEILAWARQSKAIQLKDYCEKYIKSNKGLVLEQRLEFCANAMNEQERLEETEMLKELLSDEK